MDSVWNALEYLIGNKRLRDVAKYIADMEAANVSIQQADRDHKRRKKRSPELVSDLIETQCKIENQILAWLEDDKVNRIGVYGMGGIGKTTLSKHLYNQLSETKKDGCGVAWISVGWNCTIYDLQHRIAEAVGLDLQCEKDLNRRAASLYAFLGRLSCSTLFLDDIWGEFDLEEDVGIPNQCKLILISRSLNVCRAFWCQKVIKVDPLSQVEAWLMFHRAACDSMLNSTKEIIQKAKRMCDLCGGVPLAILESAHGMRGVVDSSGWSKAVDSIYQISMGETHLSDTFNSLKLSYDSLSNDKLKTCFLYCALYPGGDSIKKEELIRVWIGETLIDDVGSLQVQYDTGHSILNKLINSCLLETTADESTVKIHDLNKYMALSIGWDSIIETSRQSLTRNPSNLECWENLKVLSLIKSEHLLTFDASPKCPSLSTLLLQHSSLYALPDSFFEHMISLRVLNLSHTCIGKLPSSASKLYELQVLDVSYCPKLREVPPVTNLKKLQYLNLSQTGIRQAPHVKGKGRNCIVLPDNIRELNVDDKEFLDNLTDILNPVMLCLGTTI